MIKREEEKRYCYKLHVSTALGKAFMKLWHLCDKAEKAADKFAAKVGAVQYYPTDSAFAGGVACVSFSGNKPPMQNVWRSVGKDADGIEMWEPDVQKRMGNVKVKDETKIPKDTATRIYKTKARKDADGHLVCDYVELYREDKVPVDKTHPKRKTPQYWSKSFRIEKERLKLPVVTTQTLMNLIGADLTSGHDTKGKMCIVLPLSPTFFRYSQSIYLRCAYPCHAEGMKEITLGEYVEMEKAIREMARSESSSLTPS